MQENISLRAYELYQRRGGEHGRDFEDWAQAEHEILSPLIEQEIKRSAKPRAEAAGNVTPAKLPSRKSR